MNESQGAEKEARPAENRICFTLNFVRYIRGCMPATLGKEAIITDFACSCFLMQLEELGVREATNDEEIISYVKAASETLRADNRFAFFISPLKGEVTSSKVWHEAIRKLETTLITAILTNTERPSNDHNQ